MLQKEKMPGNPGNGCVLEMVEAAEKEAFSGGEKKP